MNLLELYAKISLDSSEYESGVEKAKKGNKSLSDSFGGVARSAETIKNTIGVLSAQYDSAKKNVEELTKKFNESANKTGVTSQETQDLAKQLKEAESQMDSIGRELQQYNSGLEQNAQKTDAAEKSAGRFGDAFKKNFSAALKGGAALIGAATTAVVGLVTASVKGYSELEQLAGGAAKIFDEISQSRIMADAYNAYKLLGMSANEYLAIINDVGAAFSSTMGDEAGYTAAQKGLQAIADYATGTGKNLTELMGKFTLITRSTSSYQSIADQFSGILPATTEAFLEQAQAAGFLEEKYKSLTDVPLAEYQEAVTLMLEKGVAELNLAGNAASEAFTTISGSFAMAKASWSNLVAGLADDNADFAMLIDNFTTSIGAVVDNTMPRVMTALGGVVNLIGTTLPMAVEQIPPLVVQILPQLADAASGMIMALISGIENGQGDLVGVLMSVAMQIVSLVLTAAPKLLTVGVSLITQLVNGLASAAPELIPAAVSAVLQLVEGLTNPDSFSALIDGAIALIVGLTDGLIAALPMLLDSAPVIVSNLVSVLISNIPKLVLAGLDFIIALGTGIWDNLDEIGLAAWGIIETLFTSLDDYGQALIDTGAKAVEKIKAGIESTWGELASWFADLWNSVFGNLNVNVAVIGGETVIMPNSRNAGGMDYVPFNGYLSELHRGEMVLTASEAEDYRRGNRGRGTVTVIQNIYSTAKTAADLMEEARYEQEKAVLLGV